MAQSIPSSNAPILIPPNSLTMNIFYQTVNSARLNLQHTLNDFESSVRQKNLESLGDLSSWAIAMLQRNSDFRVLYSLEQTLYLQQLGSALSYNVNFLQPYNNFLNNMASTVLAPMRQLQEQYKNGQITSDQYNSAVDAWNNALADNNSQLQTQYDSYSSITNSYNDQIAANNALAQQVNAMRQRLGVTTMLPMQDPAALSTLIQLSALPRTDSPDFNLAALPTVPATLPNVPDASEATGMSTAISITPTTPQEQALLDSIQQSLDAIKNGSAEAYNRALVTSNDQIDAMNRAVSDYAAGVITQSTYMAAVNAFTSYAGSQNQTLSPLANAYIADIAAYNNNLSAINAQIDAFNAVRQANNQPLIPRQLPINLPTQSSLLLPTSMPSGTVPPNTNPLSSGPIILLPNVPEGSTTTNANTFLNDLIVQILATAVQQLIYTNNIQSNINTSEVYLDRLKGRKSKYTPFGADDRVNNVFVNELQTIASVSGVGLTTLATGISNDDLDSIITKMLLLSSTDHILGGDKPLPKALMDKILAFTLHALKEISVSAALKAAGLLANSPAAAYPGSPAVEAATALGFSNGIQALVSSGAIENALRSYLASFGYSESEIAKLISPLTSAISLSLLQFAVSQTSLGLNLPGLLPQILGNLPNASDAFRQQVVSSLDNRLQATLENNASIDTMKSIMAHDIVQGEILHNQINRAVNNFLDEAAAIRNAEDLRSTLYQNFLQQNIDQPTAYELAQRSTAFLQSESNLSDLNTAYVFREDLISHFLNNENITRAINVAQFENEQVRNYENIRQFRGAVATELQNQGSDALQAYILANDVANAQLAASEAQQSNFSSSLINQEILSNALKNDIQNAAVQSQKNAQTAANQPDAQSINTNEILNATKAYETIFLAALNQTIAQNPLSTQQFNNLLSANLLAGGMPKPSADDLARKAAIIVGLGPQQLNNPFIGFLNREDLRNQFFSNVSNQLSGVVNAPLANYLASQLTDSIIGPLEALKSHAIQRHKAILDLLDHAYLSSQVAYDNKTRDQQIENYKYLLFASTDPTIKRARNLRYFLELWSSPAHSLVFDNIPMYKTSKPKNYKESIDISV